MPSRLHDQSKLDAAATGTPRKGKRMANVLKAILRLVKVASPIAPNITESPLGAPVTENVITELKVTTSAEASLNEDKDNSLRAYLTKMLPRKRNNRKSNLLKLKVQQRGRSR
jgi:hypothetical protein